MLPKTSGYVKSYDAETRWVFFIEANSAKKQ